MCNVLLAFWLKSAVCIYSYILYFIYIFLFHFV